MEEDSLLYVEGSAGTWQGRMEHRPEVLNAEQFLQKANFKGGEDISIELDDEDEVLVYKVHHHDGVNIHYLRPLNWLKKAKLLEIVEEKWGNHKEQMANYAEMAWEEKNYKRLSKVGLIDLIENMSHLWG